MPKKSGSYKANHGAKGAVNKPAKNVAGGGIKATKSNQSRMYRTGAQKDNQGKKSNPGY